MVAEHITNLPCDKHSGKRTHTQMLVVHSIESPLANGYAVSMAKNWLGKWYDGDGELIEASANVIVSPDTLVRSVHTDYAAWHASWANSLSVGYEQAGYAAFTRAQWLTGLGKTQIDRLAREMALDAELYGIPLVWLTRTQVNAIAAGDRTIKGLVTHAVIDPANRTDPGNQYPYDVLLASIKAYSAGTTPQSGTIAPIKEDTLSAAEVNTIMAGMASMEAGLRQNIKDHFLGGTTSADGWRPGATKIVIENQRRLNKANAQIAALGEAVQQLAKGQGVVIDYDRIDAGVKAALADGIEITGTFAAKGADE